MTSEQIGVNIQGVQGHLVVTRVKEGSPAEKGGLTVGDIIVGVGGEPVTGQVDFYRKLWGAGPAGIDIPLGVLQGTQIRGLVIASIDRAKRLRARSAY